MYIIYAEYRWILVEYTQNTSHHCGRFGPSHLCGGHDTGWDNRRLLAQVSRVRSRSPRSLTARSLAPRAWERPRNPSGWSNNILEINPLHWAGTQNCNLHGRNDSTPCDLATCPIIFTKKNAFLPTQAQDDPGPKIQPSVFQGATERKSSGVIKLIKHGIAGKVWSSMLFPLKARPFGAGISQPWTSSWNRATILTGMFCHHLAAGCGMVQQCDVSIGESCGQQPCGKTFTWKKLPNENSPFYVTFCDER